MKGKGGESYRDKERAQNIENRKGKGETDCSLNIKKPSEAMKPSYLQTEREAEQMKSDQSPRKNKLSRLSPNWNL